MPGALNGKGVRDAILNQPRQSNESLLGFLDNVLQGV